MGEGLRHAQRYLTTGEGVPMAGDRVGGGVQVQGPDRCPGGEKTTGGLEGMGGTCSGRSPRGASPRPGDAGSSGEEDTSPDRCTSGCRDGEGYPADDGESDVPVGPIARAAAARQDTGDMGLTAVAWGCGAVTVNATAAQPTMAR